MISGLSQQEMLQVPAPPESTSAVVKVGSAFVAFTPRLIFDVDFQSFTAQTDIASPHVFLRSRKAWVPINLKAPNSERIAKDILLAYDEVEGEFWNGSLEDLLLEERP